MNDKLRDKYSNLKKERYPIPEFIISALNDSGLMDSYLERPAYQQNDYIG